MKILFVGSIYNKNSEKALIDSSKGGLPIASNILQWNIIDGMLENGQSIDIIGVVPIGSFPQRSKKLLVQKRHLLYNGSKYEEIGYINISLLKSFVHEKEIKKKIKLWISLNAGDDLVIIFYDLNRAFLNIIKWIKKINCCIKTCLIIPDLSGNMRNDMGYSKLKNLFLGLLNGDVLKDAQNADSYVLLTEQMNRIVNPKGSPYIVIDGVVADTFCQFPEDLRAPNEKILLYAGNLSVQYNMETLIEAFETFPELKDYKLWFCGKGNAEDMIIEAEKRDSRIHYFGQISKAELQEIEKKVSFLINPRTNNGEYTKYSFPSKNLEYLLAGRPVIAYKLDGISDDYDGIFMYVNGEGTLNLRRVLIDAYNMAHEDVIKKGKEGYEFVLEHNGAKKQAQKIITMLKGVTKQKCDIWSGTKESTSLE